MKLKTKQYFDYKYVIAIELPVVNLFGFGFVKERIKDGAYRMDGRHTEYLTDHANILLETKSSLVVYFQSNGLCDPEYVILSDIKFKALPKNLADAVESHFLLQQF